MFKKCELPYGYRKVKTKHDPLYDQALISLINEGKIYFTQTEKGFIYKSKSSKALISEDAFKEKDSSFLAISELLLQLQLIPHILSLPPCFPKYVLDPPLQTLRADCERLTGHRRAELIDVTDSIQVRETTARPFITTSKIL